MNNPTDRVDFKQICDWIPENARILDLGCGDGSLLKMAEVQRSARGYGIEINVENIIRCVAKSVNVIQSDIDNGLADFDDNSFDTAILSQTLQAVHNPHLVLQELLRVGKQGIVTFPNFGHWRCRLALLKGQMPVVKSLPNLWYDTPNIHLCTLRDFELLCQDQGIRILERAVLDTQKNRRVSNQFLPNLLGEVAIYRIEK